MTRCFSSTPVEDARDRYAVGAGLGLLLLDRDLKAKADGKLLPEEVELTAKQAAAQSALVMMPQYDRNGEGGRRRGLAPVNL